MFKLYQNEHEDEYLSEFKQKIAAQRAEEYENRRLQLQRSRNGFIGTLAGVALAAVVSWFILLPKMSESSNELPLIKRPLTPVKVQPNDPGGMIIPNQDKSVYDLVEKKVEDSLPESLLPQPETPKLPEISASEKSKNANAALLNVKPLDEKIEAVEATDGQKIKIPEKPKDISSNVTTEKALPEVQAPVEEKPKTEEPKAAVSKGHWQVQLVASANRSAVEKSWDEEVKKYAILKDLPHEVEAAENGKSTMYRLKAGDFENRSDADALCAQIKNAGGSCVVKQK